MGTKNFDSMADVVASQYKHWFLDGIACRLHNEGYSLDGNTEESDVEWFARELYESMHKGGWDRCTAQDEWRKLATHCLKLLPRIVDRIAHRYISMSEAMKGMARAARIAEQDLAKRAERRAGKGE